MHRKTILPALAPVLCFLVLLTPVAEAGAPSGEITATPSTVLLLPGQLGETVISWTTSGCANAMVTVSTQTNPTPATFAEGTSNAGRSAPWIGEGQMFFRLYGDLNGNLLLDEVVVTGRRSPLRAAGVIGNNMVLQRDAGVPVWGWADPGQTVEVGFAGQSKSAVAGPDGKWIIRLEPMPASETGRTMQISDGSNTLEFTDVVVGDVWVLSGQSNMSMRLMDCGDTAAQQRADYPWLRTFRMVLPFGTEQGPNIDPFRTVPATDVGSGSRWWVTTPQTAGQCAAVGFHFAEALRPAVGVPLGLIQTAVPSTWGECWVSKAMRDANPALHYIGTERWPKPPATPWFVDKYVMYHAMIAPLQPYGIRGVLWYQGEGNTENAVVGRYRDLLSGLIKGWRDDWGQGEFPFLIVQLPAYGGSKTRWHSYELLREAQLQVSRETANAGLAVTIDTGGTADPHPVDKQPVGERLARLARAQVYGHAIIPTGPIHAGGTADAGGVNLRFEHAGDGLQAVGGSLRNFEAAGVDGVFHTAATAITAADTVRVTCAAVPVIAEVRYGWDWNPDGNLFNSEMLPASPFRAAMVGSIAANPSKITISPGTTGSSTITWDTNLSAGAHVTRASGGGPEETIVATSTGAVTVSGLGPGETIFRLYGDEDRVRLLDSIEVTGTVSPLTVHADGTLRLDNRPFTGIGVNYFSACERILDNPEDTSFEAGFADLGRLGVPFARLDVSGFWPSRANLFFTNRTEYFRRLDQVVASAERHGVGLIPTLFWTTFTFPDLAGEHLDQLAVSNSVTRQKMREFATEIVNRYKHSRAIWAWEFGNEWSLAIDLPNGTEFLPPTWTNLGNPPTRDPVRDLLATDTILPAMLDIGRLIKELDPGRPLSTGHAMSRPSQWHQDQWNKGLLPISSAWNADSVAQAEAITLRQCPDPYDLLSVHIYGNDTLRLPDFATFAARAGKGLFAGEFGTPPADQANYGAMLSAIREHSPLAAVWVFDRPQPVDEYSITTTNSRSWMLRALLPGCERRVFIVPPGTDTRKSRRITTESP
jgi:sialate O-acetylesterase